MNDKNEMCAQRKSFAFYSSFKDAIGDMSDADKLSVYESITDFAFFGIEPTELTPIVRLACIIFSHHLCVCCTMMTFALITGQIFSYRLPGSRPIIFTLLIS